MPGEPPSRDDRGQLQREDLIVHVDVAASPAAVWTVLTAVERWHEWTPSIRSIRRHDTGPLRVGSRALVRQPRLLPALWTVVALEEGRAFTWRTGAPGAWAYGVHSVEPTDAGSRATLAVRFEGAFGWLLMRLTGSLTSRYLELEAEGLKRRAEQGEPR